ncbi:uncharacterized protein G2W53_026936 [Senna tora]|uniref:Uncharacterized protein n=1 Tax=Senna tora TaxID=362788 RepID=A0A834WJ91_9FABA|nr:uncharacterized protein G2W53_026936 [Senna tora]
MGFCIEKKLTNDSLIFDGRRSTWSTAGRPTRIALKLLGRLLCVKGSTCLSICTVADRRQSTSSSIEDLAARKLDCLETSWEVSLCPRLQFDPAYALEILLRKKVDPRLIDF